MNIKINTHVVLNATFHFFFLLNKTRWLFSLNEIIMNLLQKGFLCCSIKKKCKPKIKLFVDKNNYGPALIKGHRRCFL